MTSRFTYFLGLLIVSVLLSASIYFQVAEGFQPCPLCSLQRMTFVLLGLVFLIGLLVARKRIPRAIVNSLVLIFSLLGIFFAGRQVWLQYFPPKGDGECGVSLQYMMQVLPVNEVIQKVFAGSAECTQRGWEFLRLNMAEWSLVWFVLIFFMSIYLFTRKVH